MVHIKLTAHIPAEWMRGAVAAVVILIVLRWQPQSAVPLAFGGWLGTWLLAGSPHGDPAEGIASGRP
jgi:hypothetical protein